MVTAAADSTSLPALGRTAAAYWSLDPTELSNSLNPLHLGLSGKKPLGGCGRMHPTMSRAPCALALCQAIWCCSRLAAWCRRCSHPESTDFFVSEAVLTGKKHPRAQSGRRARRVRRAPSNSNCVFLGTNVRSGSAQCLVVKTGTATEFGGHPLWPVAGNT